MKVLFVSSGNKKFEDSPIVKNQGESLRKMGVDIEFYFIIGRGLRGYVKNIFRLKRFLETRNFDLIHAHYSLSGVVASFSSHLPLLVSLMGSDVQLKGLMKVIIGLFSLWRWNAIIVKSESMKKMKHLNRAYVIPNGVDREVFQPIDQKIAREKVGFNQKKHIIFIANPERREKNFRLAEHAFKSLNNLGVELNVVTGVGFELIPFYYYAANVLLLTSLWEGSPNVIKEAMACGLPIVSTDVGDVKRVIGETDGCYLTSFDPMDVAAKLQLALQFGRRTNGRSNIQHLNSDLIAEKMIKVYKSFLKN